MSRNTDQSASEAHTDPPALRIVVDDLSGPEIAALLTEHLAQMRADSPASSVHALDLNALRSPDVTVWTSWDGITLAGCVALTRLDDDHAEIKSMRTASIYQRRGVASILLRHLIGEATTLGYRRLSLETGSSDFFRPAQRLYTAHGFDYCGPFADYQSDPFSVFMTRTLWWAQ